MSSWWAILMAIGATILINLGFALQKRGAALAAAGEGRRSLFRIRVWRSGIVIMLAGWGLYFVAAKFAPISIVQPTLGAGLAVLALFSVFYLHEKISRREWAAFAAMLIGVLLLGLSSRGVEKPIAPDTMRLLTLTASAGLAGAALYFWSVRRKTSRLRSDALLGVAAGLLIGLGSLYIKAMFNYLEEDAVSLGLSPSALAAEMSLRRLLAFGLCLPVVIVGNILGIAVVQVGFRQGKALVVVPVQQVTNKAVAIVGGMAALGEPLPEAPALSAMRLSAFVLILIATVFLARFGGETMAEKMTGNNRT